MAAVVLRYGFKKIAGIEDYFRRGVLEKGKKLCAANYDYGVEEYCPGNDVASVVTAKCHSQVQQDEYNVNIKVARGVIRAYKQFRSASNCDREERAFDSIVQQLRNAKTQRVPAILYGTEMEPEARAAFQKKVRTRVTQLVLVTSLHVAGDSRMDQ
ncbi:uncharacterized protein LOC144097395 isoform X2 [Amblyomma americanum]